MILHQRKNDRKEERFYLDETGTLQHCLPGENPPVQHQNEMIFSFDRELSAVFPVGAAKESGAAGKDWGGYCRLRCRLVLPHRFATRHREELRKGETMEMILADAVRDVVGKEMQQYARQAERIGCKENEQTMWEQIRDGVYDRLLREGWMQEEFRPGSFRLGGV